LFLPRISAGPAFFDWKREFLVEFSPVEGESYESLKQKGLKSWLSENFESAKGMATRHLGMKKSSTPNVTFLYGPDGSPETYPVDNPWEWNSYPRFG